MKSSWQVRKSLLMVALLIIVLDQFFFVFKSILHKLFRIRQERKNVKNFKTAELKLIDFFAMARNYWLQNVKCPVGMPLHSRAKKLTEYSINFSLKLLLTIITRFGLHDKMIKVGHI